jgi:hypothetical protein
MMTNAATQAYVNALLKTVRQPTPILAELKKHWDALEQQILSQPEELSSGVSIDDPIRLPVNLLKPIKRILDETAQTRAIAYLLDPSEDHKFGKAALHAVLAKLQRGKGVSQLAALLRQKHTHVTVVPEYRFLIEGAKNRSVARNDIRVETRNGHNAGLIVIENKIDSPEGGDQLSWYEVEARKWHKKNKGTSLLVYLARKKRQTGRNDDQWLSLPYINFASALRDVWLRDRKAPGSAWLGLYISAITRGVLGIDLERPQDTTIAEIEAYIGETTK